MLARAVFEHFTEAARDVVRLAHKEARLMRHGRVGTEHLLVGLAWAAGDDDAGAVLREHGLSGERARAIVVGLVGLGDESIGGDDVRLKPTPSPHAAVSRRGSPQSMS